MATPLQPAGDINSLGTGLSGGIRIIAEALTNAPMIRARSRQANAMTELYGQQAQFQRMKMLHEEQTDREIAEAVGPLSKVIQGVSVADDELKKAVKPWVRAVSEGRSDNIVGLARVISLQTASPEERARILGGSTANANRIKYDVIRDRSRDTHARLKSRYEQGYLSDAEYTRLSDEENKKTDAAIAQLEGGGAFPQGKPTGAGEPPPGGEEEPDFIRDPVTGKPMRNPKKNPKGAAPPATPPPAAAAAPEPKSRFTDVIGRPVTPSNPLSIDPVVSRWFEKTFAPRKNEPLPGLGSALPMYVPPTFEEDQSVINWPPVDWPPRLGNTNSNMIYNLKTR